MSGSKGGAVVCSLKKPILPKGSRPERQGKKKRLLNMKVKGEVLDKLDAGIGPFGIGNLDMEDLTGERVTDPCVEDMIEEEEHEEEEKKRIRKMSQLFAN